MLVSNAGNMASPYLEHFGMMADYNDWAYRRVFASARALTTEQVGGRRRLGFCTALSPRLFGTHNGWMQRVTRSPIALDTTHE